MYMCGSFLWIFFFKQKTAYEIVDCDWSSDVCSSDLIQWVCYSHHTLRRHMEIEFVHREMRELRQHMNMMQER